MMVADTQALVAEMHQNTLTVQKNTPDNIPSVGTTPYLSTAECLPFPRLNPGQRYAILIL